MFTRDRPREGGCFTGKVWKAAGDEGDDIARDLVGRESQWWRWRGLGAGLAEGEAVLFVEVPLASDGLVSVHEEIEAAALFAVEELHDEIATPGGPCCELVARREEVRILEDRDGDAEVGLPGAGGGDETVLARLDEDEALRAEVGNGAADLAVDGPRVISVVECDVTDGDALGVEPQRVMTHGGEKEDGALSVAGDVG